MVLQGFAGRVTDLRARMRLCHPVLSPEEGGTKLLLAQSLDWLASGHDLEPVDRDDVLSFGTLWRDVGSTIRPGFGVAVAGDTLGASVLDMTGPAGMDDLPFEWDDDVGCWIAIVRRGEFERCAESLAREAATIFDNEFRSTSHLGKLSRKGAAALFVLRRVPRRRDSAVAIRELAAAHVETNFDLYRRLLAVQSVKLGIPEDDLDQRVSRHVSSAQSAVFSGRLPQKLPLRRVSEKVVCDRRFAKQGPIELKERAYGKQKRTGLAA